MTPYRLIVPALAAAMLLSSVAAPAASDDAGERRFRETYRELVETDTTLSNGSCTLAAERMAARLRAAGFAPADARVIVPDAFPKQGNLVARLAGSEPRLPAVLLLAHIDVVEARRADWQRDPFKLVEENGFFYARGAVDDKAMAAAFVDALVRYREEGFRPRRTIKLALTCGEETDATFNGVSYLLAREPDTLRAGWAINEGGRGQLDAAGKPVSFGVQTGEKIYQDFSLATSAPGGHSARPTDDNAIARLAGAMARVAAMRFPIKLVPASQGFFARSAPLHPEPLRADLAAIGGGAADAAAFERVAGANPLWNAFLRTTCIPTLIEGGHAQNAQPQSARGNVNCRIMPGETVEQVRARLVQAIGDPKVALTLAAPPGPQPAAPPLSPEIMGPIEQIAGAMWPGVPVIPAISSGATDGRFLNAAGIPTYGVSGMFGDPDGNGVHGLDERIRVQSLLDGRVFLYRLVRRYSEGDRRPGR